MCNRAYIFLSLLHNKKERPIIYFTQNLLCMRGLILIYTITHLILCDYIFVAPVDYVWVNIHLKKRLHKRRLSLKKDCVMNMRDLRHEYEGYAL